MRALGSVCKHKIVVTVVVAVDVTKGINQHILPEHYFFLFVKSFVIGCVVGAKLVRKINPSFAFQGKI